MYTYGIDNEAANRRRRAAAAKKNATTTTTTARRLNSNVAVVVVTTLLFSCSSRNAATVSAGFVVPASPAPRSLSASTTSSSRLYLSKKKKKKNDRDNKQLGRRKYVGGSDAVGGLNVGLPALALSIALCVWLFTVPPEFRRAYICPADLYCIQQPELCYKECTTWSEWFSQLSQYYRTGGGVQWDFSVDPRTVETNRQKLELLLDAAQGGIE